jgi:hypothetical protein
MSDGPRRKTFRLLWSDFFAIACIVAVLVFSLVQNWF